MAATIYRALREAVISGVLTPGYALKEIHLSQLLTVSTTPVREAIRQLERDGLVKVRPRRGVVVAWPDPHEIAQLCDLVDALDCRAARRASETQRANPSNDFSSIDSLVRRAGALLSQPDQIEFMRNAIALHRAIAELGGNLRLAETVERTYYQIHGVRIRCVPHLRARPAISHRQHIEIVDAIRSGDADRAEALMHSHTMDTSRAIMGALEIMGELDGE